ncbi:hypothetical protein [Nonomuraea basaltis]|uniref:hypothetical protein n=1 Tax=Nonomuraea basaltis TaxID=2495887 RepID=UPI00110C6516|nr:hypothetical protein [Nonomuraea basaltis]TMR95584.1 hypothetical protein EJK15_27905 [Nonomuraea basaltis]
MTPDEFYAVYALGFHAGEETGYGRRLAEEEAMWAELAEHVRKHANMRTFAEIQQARKEAA